MNLKNLFTMNVGALFLAQFAFATENTQTLMHCYGAHHSYTDVVARNETVYIKTYTDADEEEAPAKLFQVLEVEKDNVLVSTPTLTMMKEMLGASLRGDSNLILKARPSAETNDLAVINLNTSTNQSFYVSPRYNVEELTCRVSE